MSGRLLRLLERLPVLAPLGPLPSEDDIDHYLRLREALGEVYGRIIDRLPKRAVREVAAALALHQREEIVVPPEGMIDPLTDCCMYGWVENGRNLVQKYAEECPPPADPDEREALAAMLRARYAVLTVDMQLPGAGASVVDMVTGEKSFVIDVALSVSPGAEAAALAGHVLPVNEFSMLAGGAIGMERPDAWRLLKDLDPGGTPGMREFLDRPEAACAVLRWCRREIPDQAMLYVNVGEIVRLGRGPADAPGPEVLRPAAVSLPRLPSRNGPCPCGSGRQHKRCCGKNRRALRSA